VLHELDGPFVRQIVEKSRWNGEFKLNRKPVRPEMQTVGQFPVTPVRNRHFVLTKNAVYGFAVMIVNMRGPPLLCCDQNMARMRLIRALQEISPRTKRTTEPCGEAREEMGRESATAYWRIVCGAKKSQRWLKRGGAPERLPLNEPANATASARSVWLRWPAWGLAFELATML
jgi:hypothetical protein